MHSVGGNLKEVLLEYDGKSYREFLILLGREVFMICFKELFQQLPVTTE